MQDPDDIDDHELFDTSDIEWEFIKSKNLCRFTLVAKSDIPINDLKLYWALKSQLALWEYALGIESECPLEQ